MKKGAIIGLILFAVIVIIVIYYYNKKNDSTPKISRSMTPDGQNKILTYTLPTSMDSEVFGPHYWGALHSVVDEIPCSICRNDGKSLMIFAHDLVNKKLGKPIFDQNNFKIWSDFVCEKSNLKIP